MDLPDQKCPYTPPMPPERPEKLAFWRIWFRAHRNLFAALPRKLYRAWLTEVRTPWYNSYMPNQPDLVRRMLVEEPDWALGRLCAAGYTSDGLVRAAATPRFMQAYAVGR